MLRPGPVLPLRGEDLEDESVHRRLEAPKTARFRPTATPAARIAALCEAASAHRTGPIAVFVERVQDARAVGERLARAHGAERVAVLTGTLRGHERSALVSGARADAVTPGGVPDDDVGGQGRVGSGRESRGDRPRDAPINGQRLGRVNRVGLEEHHGDGGARRLRFGTGREARDGRGAAPRGARRGAGRTCRSRPCGYRRR